MQIGCKKDCQKKKIRKIINALIIATPLLLILSIVSLRDIYAPSKLTDYYVYFLGSKIALKGLWNDLYPVPIKDSPLHPGWPEGSVVTENYEKIAIEYNIPVPFRYVYTPASAVTITFFGLFNYEISLFLWKMLLVLCCWGCGLVAANIYALVSKRDDYTWAIPLFLVTCSPLSLAAIRVANSSPISALFVSLLVQSLINQRLLITSSSFFFGSIYKFAAIPLLPVIIAVFSVRKVLCFIGIQIIVLCLFVSVTGIGAWISFMNIIIFMRHPHVGNINISIQGFLTQIELGKFLYPVSASVQLLGITLAVITSGLSFYCVRKRFDPQTVSIACCSLVSWFLAFAPTTQSHYFVYLFPFWGLMSALASRTWISSLTASVLVLGTGIPFGGSSRPIPAFLNCHELWSILLLYLFCISYMIDKLRQSSIEQ